jgi:hypothetical protein
MRRERRTHIHPTTRDNAILAYIGETGLASEAQIHARFWPTAKRQTCLDRLRKLCDAGVLANEITSARGRVERVFWTGRRARLLFSADARTHFQSGRPARAEMAHLLRTRAVLDLLYRSGRLISFTSEHRLKSEAGSEAGSKAGSKTRTRQAAGSRAGRLQVADGRMLIADRQVSGEGEGSARAYREYLLEIDGAYYGQRLRAKVAALARASQSVLWVTGSAKRLARLKILCASSPSIHPILFTDLQCAYAAPPSS